MNYSSKLTLYLICHCLNQCRNFRPLVQNSTKVTLNTGLKMQGLREEIHDIKKKLCHCNHTYQTMIYLFF